MMFRSLLSFALFSAFSVQAAAKAQPTPEEFWNKTDVNIQVLKGMLSDSYCYKGNERQFISCVLGLQAAVREGSKGKFILVTQKHIDRYPQEYGNIEAKIGDMRITKSAFNPQGSIPEIFAAEKAKFKRDLAIIKSHYRQRTYLFRDALDWLKRNYLNSNNEAMVAGVAISKVYNVLYDPHTYIQPKALFEYLSQADNEKFFGVGISIMQMQGYILVREVLTGGPSEKAGVKPLDLITHIDGEDIKDLPMSDAVSKLKGKEGSKVTVTVKRGDLILDIDVYRGEVIVNNVESERLSAQIGDIGYVKLNSFMPENSCTQVRDAISEFKSSNPVEGLILDLRGNGGGRLEIAVCIVNLFVGPGKTVITARNPNSNQVQQTWRTNNSSHTSLPTVVLIDARSASASEIVSGALKDYERAFIVGETSFGKGTMQGIRTWHIDSKVHLALTTARFHLASGWSNQGKGVTADFTTYSNPKPSPEDRFAVRESDEFLPLSSGPQSYAASAKRKQIVRKIKDCLVKSDRAERAFERNSNVFYDADFQLYQALDTLDCADKL